MAKADALDVLRHDRRTVQDSIRAESKLMKKS